MFRVAVVASLAMSTDARTDAEPVRPVVYAVATMDTKGRELEYVGDRLRATGVDVVLVDVGTATQPTAPADIAREEVATCHPEGRDAVLAHRDRGRAVTAMSEAAREFMQREFAEGKLAGLLGIGGSGGTAIATAAMRALPIGVPKLMVSTVASGNVQPYVGCCDVTMMYSVVDVAGINRVSREVLANAAHAMSGMVHHRIVASDAKQTLAMTMFGVTTPCVTTVRERLETRGYDCLVFHATGTGGRAMEKLVASGMIDGVLDITTTEVADEVVGGILSAGPDRFDAILERRIPCVMSLGALDMVNFGAKPTVPECFKDRRMYVHNPQVTLMRTTPEENRQFARWIAAKINRSTAPLTLLIPEKGVSTIDAPGQPFHHPEADIALFEELASAVEQTPTRRLRRLPYHINDTEFAEALVEAYLELT